MTAAWSLGDEYRAADELEALRDEVLALPHSPACPGNDGGCWCPVSLVLALIDDRMMEMQPDRFDP